LGNNERVYDFTSTGDGKLVVNFDTVLTTFTLTVTVHFPKPSDPLPLDPTVFPPNTVCVKYPINFVSQQCDQYDFSGNKSGPNGVPVKNVDYKKLITLTLSYFNSQTTNFPAFGHAPGDITTFTENILTSYFEPLSDPTMVGKTPGLSSVVALDEPANQTNVFCFKSPTSQTFNVGQEIEVTFQLFAGGNCFTPSGPPIRDKTASSSLAKTDSSGNFVSFPPLLDKEEGNKFHWYDPNGLNEFDLSTIGLAAGTYTITVIGSKFSPQSINITLN